MDPEGVSIIECLRRKVPRKNIVMPAKPINRLVVKHPIKPYKRNSKCVKTRSPSDAKPKKKRLRCHPIAASSEALQDKEVNIVPKYIMFKGKTDPELEGDLIPLKEHPKKNEMYNPDGLPKLSLLCLTPGIGYLPIVEFNQDVLAVQNPLCPELYHSFKNLETANLWLNRFFKNRLIFETMDTFLKWVLVKPGIIKLMQSSPFNAALPENPSIVVTRDGGLIFKKKNLIAGDFCRVQTIRVGPLSLTDKDQSAITYKNILEKQYKVSNPVVKIEDDFDKDAKCEKIRKPLHEQIVKGSGNLFRQFPSLKLPETKAINQFTNQGVTITPKVDTTAHYFTVASSLRNNSLYNNNESRVRLNVDNLDSECSTLFVNGATPTNSANKDVQEWTRTCSRNDDVQQYPTMISIEPFSGYKIISHEQFASNLLSTVLWKTLVLEIGFFFFMSWVLRKYKPGFILTFYDFPVQPYFFSLDYTLSHLPTGCFMRAKNVCNKPLIRCFQP